MKSLIVLFCLLVSPFAFATPDCSNPKEKARVSDIAEDLKLSIVGQYGIEAVRVRDCSVFWAAKVLGKKVSTVVKNPECGVYFTFASPSDQQRFASVVIKDGGRLRSEDGQVVRVCGAVAQ